LILDLIARAIFVFPFGKSNGGEVHRAIASHGLMTSGTFSRRDAESTLKLDGMRISKMGDVANTYNANRKYLILWIDVLDEALNSKHILTYVKNP
jgi:hypothetical protein